MSFASLFNFTRRVAPPDLSGATEVVQPQRVLRRILSFTGRTIDDVVNDPRARNEVLGYYKLHRWVQRTSEISELERQWNTTSR